jgi:tetratricopeptide (TPR) repeat protein
MEILKNYLLKKISLSKVKLGSLIILVFLLSPFELMAQNNIEQAFKESYELESSGNLKSAAQKLIAVYDAESYEINLRLGWLTYQAGQLKESADYYNKSIQLKPYAIEPKLGLAYPLSVQGKTEELLSLYLKIIQVDSQNSLVNYRVGLIYYNQGKFDKADPYLEKVVNLFPFDYDGLILLAWNKLSLQKSREAKVLFQKALWNRPGDKSALDGIKLIK